MIGVAQMADKDFHCTGAGTPGGALLRARPALAVLAAIAAGLLSGCAHRDSVTVGSIPDDYRTNHPIMVAEKNEAIDLPVGVGDRGMTETQHLALGGFLDSYDYSALPVVTITVPRGSGNEVAAADAARDFRHFIRSHGIPGSRIMMASYQAPAVDVSAPVRVSYVAMRAQTNKCGRWPEDIADDSENKHYADFGCSYQNNLAAQIANPADLLGPRKLSEVDAEKRGIVIDEYEKPPRPTASEVDF
jgi:pilus assembly protein CpaD